MNLYPKFKIRVVYKSGYHHDFWVWKFEGKNGKGGIESAEWSNSQVDNRPVFLNVGEIESVWKIGVRWCFRFTSPV